MNQNNKYVKKVMRKHLTMTTNQSIMIPLSNDKFPYRKSLHQIKKSQNNIISYPFPSQQSSPNIHQYAHIIEFPTNIDSYHCFYPTIPNRFSHSAKHQHVDIAKFSDLKRRTVDDDGKQGLKGLKWCQNHRKCEAKFYILTNQDDESEKRKYFCLQCSINLFKMNFQIQQIPTPKQQIQAPSSPNYLHQNNSNNINIPSYNKNNTNINCNSCKNAFKINKSYNKNNKCNNCQKCRNNWIWDALRLEKNVRQYQRELEDKIKIENIDEIIEITEEKYNHVFYLLQQIKNQEIMELNRIKTQLLDIVAQQAMQVQAIHAKLSHILHQSISIQQHPKIKNKHISNNGRIYGEQIQRIGRELQLLKQSKPLCRIRVPKQLRLEQIVRRLSQMFNETVHELSFEEVIEKTCNFNSTFGCPGIVEGIECVLSQSQISGEHKQNILSNINI